MGFKRIMRKDHSKLRKKSLYKASRKKSYFLMAVSLRGGGVGKEIAIQKKKMFI